MAASPVFVDPQRQQYRRSNSTAASSTTGSVIGGFGGGGGNMSTYGGGSRHQSPSANSVASFASSVRSSVLGGSAGTGQATPSRLTPRRRRLLCLQPTEKERWKGKSTMAPDVTEGWGDVDGDGDDESD